MKTKEQLNTQIDQTIFPNTQGLIDAQKENLLLKEMVDSSFNKMTDAPLDNKIYGLKNQGISEIPLNSYIAISEGMRKNTARARTQAGEFQTGTYQNNGGVETITFDISVDDIDTEVDGVGAIYLWQLEDPDVLITNRNTVANSDDENGLYRLTAYTQNVVAVYTKIDSKDVIYVEGIHANTFYKIRKRATSDLGDIVRTFYGAIAAS